MKQSLFFSKIVFSYTGDPTSFKSRSQSCYLLLFSEGSKSMRIFCFSSYLASILYVLFTFFWHSSRSNARTHTHTHTKKKTKRHLPRLGLPLQPRQLPPRGLARPRGKVWVWSFTRRFWGSKAIRMGKKIKPIPFLWFVGAQKSKHHFTDRMGAPDPIAVVPGWFEPSKP